MTTHDQIDQKHLSEVVPWIQSDIYHAKLASYQTVTYNAKYI